MLLMSADRARRLSAFTPAGDAAWTPRAYGRPTMRIRRNRDEGHVPAIHDPAQQAREAALTAVATVVAQHLREENESPKLRHDRALPLIVHVHGPGKSTFLERLSGQ